MEISRPNDQSIELARLDPLFAELFRQIVPSADPSGSDAASARIFSPPSHDPEEESLMEDWQSLIKPELARLFRSALQTIEADLRLLRIDPKTGEGNLIIPIDHLDSWIHGLNQARLVLAERHSLNEDEEAEREPPPASDPKSFVLLQMHFYAEMQYYFLRLIDRS